TVASGKTAGTFALVVANPYGHSSTVVTAANSFTIVDPGSTADSDGDKIPNVIEAAYGTNPLDPNSVPSANSHPLSGEVGGVPFSVLNTAAPAGSRAATMESDGVPFSVLNTAAPAGSPEAIMEADGVPLSYVQNKARSTNAIRRTVPLTRQDILSHTATTIEKSGLADLKTQGEKNAARDAHPLH